MKSTCDPSASLLSAIAGVEANFDAQFQTIKALLAASHRESLNEEAETKRLEGLFAHISNEDEDRLIDEVNGHYQEGVYFDAARSLSAVGMLAPLIESLFSQFFAHAGAILEKDVHGEHERWSMALKNRWDCHWVMERKGPRKDLVAGIMQLSEATGLMEHFPPDIKQTLTALFTFRNRMLHHGLEWPPDVRNSFAEFIKPFPKNWFSSSTSGGEPWVFYMTEDFVQHLLKIVEAIFETITDYTSDVLYPRLFPSDASSLSS